jgi:hypothetical protein
MNRYENSGSLNIQWPSPPWHAVTCPDCSFEYHTLYPGSNAGCPGCYAQRKGWDLSEPVEAKKVEVGALDKGFDIEPLKATIEPAPQPQDFQRRTVITRGKS